MPEQTEFELSCGFSIRLDSIEQWRTYGGLLEGLPTREMNARNLAYLLNMYTKQDDELPYLITPEETAIEVDRDYLFGEPSRVPAITCVAVFDSGRPAKDESTHGSSLTVIWFQDEIAFPIDDSIVDEIHAIDWREQAHDYYLSRIHWPRVGGAVSKTGGSISRSTRLPLSVLFSRQARLGSLTGRRGRRPSCAA